MSDTFTSFYSFVSDDCVTAVCDSSWSTNSEREYGVTAGKYSLASTINTALRSSSVAVQGIIEWAAAKAYSAYKSDSSTYSAYSTTNLANISLFSSYSDISDLINTAISYCIDNATSDTLDSLTSNLESIQSSLENGTITAYYASHLGSSTIGSAGNPIYLSSGSPIACTNIHVLSNLILLYGGGTIDSDLQDMLDTGTSGDYYSIYACFDTLTADSIYSNVIDIGYKNIVSYDNSICLGYNNTVANDSYQVSIGFNNNATGKYSIAAGYGNYLVSEYSIVLGHGNLEESASESILFGSLNTTYGDHAVLLGYYNFVGTEDSTSYGSYSITAGSNNTITGNYSIASGYTNTIDSEYSIILGSDISSSSADLSKYTCNYTISIGNSNAPSAYGDNSISIGSNITSYQTNSIAIGSYAMAANSYAISIGGGTSTYYSSALESYDVALGYRASACGSASDDNKSSSQISFCYSSSYGSINRGIYLNNGIITACSESVGSSKEPIYMDNGVIAKCSMWTKISSSYYTLSYRVGSNSFSTLTLSTSTDGYTDTFSLYAFQYGTLLMFTGSYQCHTDTLADDTIYRIKLPSYKYLPGYVSSSSYYTYSSFLSATCTSINSQITNGYSSLSLYYSSQLFCCWGTTTYLYFGADVHNLTLSLGNSYCVGFSFIAYYLLKKNT